MANKNVNYIMIVALAAFMLIGADLHADAKNNSKPKYLSSVDSDFGKKKQQRDSIHDSLLQRALDLFNKMILRSYLYGGSRAEVLDRYHAFASVSDSGFTKNYGIFSANSGDPDAKLFWSMIKDALYKENLALEDNARIITKPDNNSHIVGNTMIVLYNNTPNPNAFWAQGAFLFGGDYIDFDNEYVAQYIAEIKQLCTEMKIAKTRSNRLRNIVDLARRAR